MEDTKSPGSGRATDRKSLGPWVPVWSRGLPYQHTLDCNIKKQENFTALCRKDHRVCLLSQLTYSHAQIPLTSFCLHFYKSYLLFKSVISQLWSQKQELVSNANSQALYSYPTQSETWGGLGGRELESTHLYFNKSSRWFWRMLKFNIYCLKWTEIYQWNPQGHPPATSSSSSDLCAIHWSQPSAHCHCDHVVSPLRYMPVPIPTGRAYSSYLLVNAGRKGGRDEGHA